MTVGELMERLEQLPDTNLPVMLLVKRGDDWPNGAWEELKDVRIGDDGEEQFCFLDTDLRGK